MNPPDVRSVAAAIWGAPIRVEAHRAPIGRRKRGALAEGDAERVHPRSVQGTRTATLTLNDALNFQAVSHHTCFLGVPATGAWGHRVAQAQCKGDCAPL